MSLECIWAGWLDGSLGDPIEIRQVNLDLLTIPVSLGAEIVFERIAYGRPPLTIRILVAQVAGVVSPMLGSRRSQATAPGRQAAAGSPKCSPRSGSSGSGLERQQSGVELV